MPPALFRLLASTALLLAAACERDEVSLGDDTLAIAAPDAAPVAPPEDAGDEPIDDHHDDPPDAGHFDDDDAFSCGFCNPGELCTRPDDPGCDERELPVRCVRIEDICPPRAAPVCGCDGQSYGSRCEAVALGAVIRTDGACKPPEEVVQCASFAEATCGQEAYCRFALGAFCGMAGVLGSCEPRPERCDEFGRAVCGCDGRSYRSACWAAMSGVSVAFLGSCENGGGRL